MIIDQLPLLASAQATDEIPIERGVTTYKAALSTMLDVAKSTATPPKDGTAAVGSSDKFARQDHRHPLNVATSGTPKMDGTASLGSATDYARTDHVHPTDTSRQETLVSGTNIKTINNNSLLGSGDITIGGAVDSVNGQTGTVVLDADDVGAMSEWALLWANASPTSSFAAQTVPFSYSGYDMIFIMFNSNGIGDLATVYQVAENGLSVTGYTYLNSVNRKREGAIVSTGIAFQGAVESGQTKNTVMIPWKIYGIKGVQTS